MFSVRAAIALCGAGLVLGVLPARALDPRTALAAYGFQSWQTDSGLPQNTVHAIVQTRDGFLWIATEGGLVRFDGASFAVTTHENTPSLPSDLIDGLMEDRWGVLWVSTSGGLARVRGGQVAAFGEATQVWRTFEDARGTVWALTASGLFRVHGDQLERVPLDADLTEKSIMAQGGNGELWLGTEEGLREAGEDGTFHPAGSTDAVAALAVDGGGRVWFAQGQRVQECPEGGDCHTEAIPQSAGAVHALVRDPQGRMWAGTDAGLYAISSEIRKIGSTQLVEFLWCDRQGSIWAGTAQGLMRVAPDGSTELLRGGDVYLSAMEDREGDLWLGTEAGGLEVLRDRKFSTLTAQDGLSDEYVLALADGPHGELAAGTNGGGLDLAESLPGERPRFHALTTAQGLPSNVVLSVATAANGDVWAGTPDGLTQLHDGRARTFTTADGLADDFVRSLYVAPDGSLWIGTRHGLSRYANATFTTWTALDGLGSDLVGAIAEDAQSNLWIGTLGGLTKFRDGHFGNFTTKDGLSSNVITALYAGARTGAVPETLWIGTNDAGLNRMRAGKIVPVRAAGLPQRVTGILEDGAGYLWVSSNTGVFRVRESDLDRAVDAGANPDVMRFGVADGMRISECSSGGHPEALATSDGRLWFATLKGIAVVDPEHMPVNRVPPLVALERVLVDDVPQSALSPLRIAPGHSHYEFDYAGLSFAAPQKVEYRYQLTGFDKGWVDAGTRHVAYYTNLPHGRYTFRVMARNNDGVWSETSASAPLTIEPHVYQTLWFEALAALALIGLGYALWRRRLLGVELQYEAVLGERTRIAREIHDTLAQGFVAVSVQLELIAQLMQISVDAAKEQLQQTRAMVKSSLEDARTSIWELRSQTAEPEDLAARLLKLTEEVIARGGSQARAQMQVTGTYRPLDAEMEREVLRIAREAVTNAVRHGDPENVQARLEFDESLFGMEICDDGQGFDGTPADGRSGHFGLTGMKERAAAIRGSLKVESSSGHGTTVRLEVPLEPIAAKIRM